MKKTHAATPPKSALVDGPLMKQLVPAHYQPQVPDVSPDLCYVPRPPMVYRCPSLASTATAIVYSIIALRAHNNTPTAISPRNGHHRV